jgi:DNA adenine methylase
MRSPILWYGGKGQLVSKLKDFIPHDYDYYVEPFFGGGSLFFSLRPASVETINDIDSAVMGFFKVLRDRDTFEDFLWLAQHTPYSRELWDECEDKWREEDDPVMRAWRWWVVARQSFAGAFGVSWGTTVTMSRRGMPMRNSSLLSTVEYLPDIHYRLRCTQIENRDAREVIEAYGVEGAFVYCDPPYVMSTRQCDHDYDHGFTIEDHEELVELLLQCPADVMVSGYPHEVYDPLIEAGWETHTWDVISYAAAKTRRTGIQGEGAAKRDSTRVECIWMNYDPEEEDHLF